MCPSLDHRLLQIHRYNHQFGPLDLRPWFCLGFDGFGGDIGIFYLVVDFCFSSRKSIRHNKRRFIWVVLMNVFFFYFNLKFIELNGFARKDLVFAEDLAQT